MKFDDSDRVIVRELQTDGRMPVANLARVVGLSQTAVRHRLQKMLQSQAVQIVAVGEPRLLGYGVEAMLGVTLDGDPRIAAEAFGKIAEVMNVMVCAGRYELLVEVICKDNFELEKLLTHQLRPIEGVKNVEIFLYLKTTKDSYNWCDPV